MDPGFVNDTTVYYNLPSSSKQQEGKRRSTLPRPHSSFIFDRSTSCPSSPKLSVFKTKRTNQSSCSQTANRSDDKSLESSVVSDSSTSSGHEKKIKGELHQVAGSCEPLENSEVIYQNVGTGSRKSRKKSSIFPWWKRKKHSHEEDVCTTYKLLSTETTGAHSLECNPDSTTSTDYIKSSQKPISEIQMPYNYLNLPRRTSSCSSSTTTINDDDENEFNTLGERVLGGVSYVKPTKAFENEDPNDKNASTTNVSENAELSGKLGHWVREWRRKSRWLSRRIREKNPRHSGEEDLDIAIIHSENDTSIWAEYLNKNFQNLLQDKLGRPQVRVEKINIESFAGYHQVPEVQASRISNAKLQIVILSPGFLSFLDAETELHFEKLLRSNRVLALFLGVTKENLRDGPLALSSLYSFEEWKCFQVRDRDETFVTQVQEESLRILTSCEVFDQCKSYSPFSLCPRKITQSYCRLYIHLKSPLLKGQDSKIRVTVDQSPSKCSVSTTVQCHNPFTLSFVMPEKLLGVSSFLKVNLYIEDKHVGSREVKSEGPLEILNDILKNAVDPIELMCQALGISPSSNDLDELLAQRVRKKLPLSGLFCGQNKEGRDIAYQELPTWLHFSAFYGLENFTWALLDIHSIEKSLLVKNNQGRTPAKLALQSGYTRLAQDLEKLVIVTSLALKTFPHSQQLPGHVKDSFTENYNLVPSNPRPKSYKNLSSYDTPPHPRSIKDITIKDSISTYENVTSTPKGGEIVYANLLRSPSIQFSDDSSIKNSRSDHEGEEYLDMSGTSSQFEEYQKDVSILVDAWDKRNDARTFLCEYQHTISKIKNNFHFNAPTIGECAPSPIPEESEELDSKDKGATGRRVEKWILRFLKR